MSAEDQVTDVAGLGLRVEIPPEELEVLLDRIADKVIERTEEERRVSQIGDYVLMRMREAASRRAATERSSSVTDGTPADEVTDVGRLVGPAEESDGELGRPEESVCSCSADYAPDDSDEHGHRDSAASE